MRRTCSGVMGWLLAGGGGRGGVVGRSVPAMVGCTCGSYVGVLRLPPVILTGVNRPGAPRVCM